MDSEPMLPGPRGYGPVQVAARPILGFKSFAFGIVPANVVALAVVYMVGPAWLLLTLVSAIVVLPHLVLACIWFCFRNSFQIWALRRPNNLISRLVLPILGVVEGMNDLHPYYDQLRNAWGPNFCVSGQVCLGEWSAIEKALTQPQARTYNLGSHPFLASHLPKGEGGRDLLLLPLSNKEAGGDGSHEAFRACLHEYVFNSSVLQRRVDTTARRLLDELAKDYKEMPHGYGESFWKDKVRGLTPFVVKFLHHALFNMDVSKQQDVEALVGWHGGEKNLGHYLLPFGYLSNKGSSIDRLASIYEAMPCFDKFKEGNPVWQKMTRREAALLMLTIMRMAGVQGTHLACMITWDTLDLSKRELVKGYVLEVLRLAAPVSTSHRVATEDFDVAIQGKKYTFPRGTKILIPMSLGMTDTSVWGEDAYELKLNRPKLHTHHMGFNTVGSRHNGRGCPGKDLALDTLADILQALGKVRHSC